MNEIEKIRIKIKELQDEFISIHPKDCSLELIKSYAGYVYLDKVLSFLDTLENSDTKKDEKVPVRIYLGSKYEFIRRDIILKEIEGLKKNNEVSDDKEYAPYELDIACGYDMACDDILSFLDSLESEKTK